MRAFALTVTMLLVASTVMADPNNCTPPRLLILFDSSGSLGSKSNLSSNYNIAVNAVLSMTQANEGKIEFGMLLFPASPDAMRCQTSTTLAVPFGLNNHAAFKAFFDSYAGPQAYSDTPMLQVIKTVLDAKPGSGVGLLKEEGIPSYVLLLTDGSQDCCYDEYYGTGWGWDSELDCNWGMKWGDPNYWNKEEFAENRTELVQMVQNLKNQNIPVFVVGFGQQVDGEALDAMAKAGGTARAPGCGAGTPVGPCYYQADNAAELVGALSAITVKVSEEQCNYVDDDCDGLTDEDVTRPCSTPCGSGVEECVGGVFGPCSAPTPEPEVCNGFDDDCDGVTDNFSEQCMTACGFGTRTCVDGQWGLCSSEPKEEICNGLDDDCDGITDEGCDCIAGQTEDCGLAVGACKPGKRTCDDGKWGECVGAVGPKPETCNGLDDDCDGVVDGMTRPCNSQCGSGVETCKEGTWVDCSAPQPKAEACNGLDDDCNGKVDDGLERPCETDCGKGVEACADGVWRGCTAPQPIEEKCDNVDNDCDGKTDEDTEIPCQTDCGKGVRSCVNGQYGPCELTTPADEVCDGLDNDCNGQVDDGAPCDNGGKCVCGGCAYPPENGECRQGVMMDGLCVVDNCGPGKVCVDSQCVEGQAPEPAPEVESDAGSGYEVELAELRGGVAPGGGCGCRQGLDPSGRNADITGTLGFLGLMLAWGLYRRKAW